MTTLVYKNHLLIERASSHYNYVYQNMNITFEDQNIPFQYKSPLDKIIFCFDKNICNEHNQQYLDPSFDLSVFRSENSNLKLNGIIKIYLDGPSIKIYYIKFEDDNLIKNNLITFKEYLIKTIMDNSFNESQIDSSHFSIYWEPSILTDKIKNIAKYVGLLYENVYGTFTFTSNNIKDFFNNIFELKNKDPIIPTTTSSSFTDPTTTSSNSFTNTTTAPTTTPITTPTTTSSNSFTNPTTTSSNSFTNPTTTSSNSFTNPSLSSFTATTNPTTTSSNFFTKPTTSSFTSNSLSSTKPFSGFNSFTTSGFSNGFSSSGGFKK